MHDEITVDLAELTKLFVACPKQDCGAEIGFDLTKLCTIKEVKCPVCGTVLDEVLPAELQPGHKNSTWLHSFWELLRARRPRMFFRISACAPSDAEK